MGLLSSIVSLLAASMLLFNILTSLMNYQATSMFANGALVGLQAAALRQRQYNTGAHLHLIILGR